MAWNVDWGLVISGAAEKIVNPAPVMVGACAVIIGEGESLFVPDGNAVLGGLGHVQNVSCWGAATSLGFAQSQDPR